MEEIHGFIESLREQRHDFMNELQIIYGYLQVDKYDKAKEFIKKISLENESLSQIYSLGDNYLGYCLEKNIKRVSSRDIDVNIDIEISYFSKKHFYNEYNKKINLVNNIFNDLEKIDSKSICIYIFEDSMGEGIFISNSESMIDEMNWMENWENIDVSVEGIKIYKCSYKNELAYRLIF
ncbi:Spo0B domain-containing protein [Clostridium tetanomorphum]|uniref:SpoOB alpha-helical domain-containing protein n=1 Tax=Clostridium tetanomorphum TaxID=1553 RepID=A0A923J128_CLOTT|nr:Spo0B domain-containing protein [Clostridium tetanomorphum]MBC2397330.1 hypothetical protein [Clostridium tetanomorphum]NRZ96379.1 sensor histidine kinase regulating citrate/malate metabolism [Clostridium tetanomorphum]